MQLTFENKTIDQLSIELIQAYEPPKGYYLGFSGGKDSVVIHDLAKRSGVKFTAHYSVSPIDPPQIHQFIKQNYPDVVWDKLASGFFSRLVPQKGLPLRTMRWCCQVIKESGGEGQSKILGMRHAESSKRSSYPVYISIMKRQRGKGKRPIVTGRLLPIAEWSDADVWQYITERGLKVCSLYSQGYSRIGCILCPFAPLSERRLATTMFPKIANAWKSAAGRYLEIRKANNNLNRKLVTMNTEEYFNWWISR